MYSFHLHTRILAGPCAEILDAMHIKRLLVVSDPFFAKNGTASAIARAEAVEIFDRVAPDPSLSLAAEGTSLLQAFRPDTVVALGGGSAMDCAKAMCFFSGLKPRLIAVPTTSGSGSEVTDFAILTQDGCKHPLVDESLRPDVAILDESLLQALPPSLIAEGGFDLLSHALESFVAVNANPFTDCLASEAFCVALRSLPGSFAGDTSLRLPIHGAATMAGIAFSQAGLGLCHAASHVLGGEFHVSHGTLNAILLPHVIDCNAPAAAGRYSSLARQAGLSQGADPVALRSLKNTLLQLRRKLGLPQSLREAGIPDLPKQLDALCDRVLQDPCCKTNPLPVTKTLARRLLTAAWGHPHSHQGEIK